jgi:hypothetical protein
MSPQAAPPVAGFRVRCFLCGRTYRLNDVLTPVPNHVVAGAICPGSGLEGRVVRRDELRETYPSVTGRQ